MLVYYHKNIRSVKVASDATRNAMSSSSFLKVRLPCGLKMMVQKRHARFVPNKKITTPSTEKRLDIVILGYPNVGKSTLLNSLVETKLAATTRKRNTTRGEIMGVFNYRNVQLAFYDTPGFVRTSDAKADSTMQLRTIAAASALKADVVLLVVDANIALGNRKYEETFCEMVQIASDNAKTELILVLNKVDLVIPKSKLLEVTFSLVSLINGIKLGPEGAKEARLDTTTFMVSAKDDDGVIDLKNYLIAVSKPKKWIIPKDKDKKGSKVTNLSAEERVQEIVLEVLLENTHHEIPYIAGVDCRSIDHTSTTRCQIDVDILVDSKSQQRIVVGQKGRTLLKIRAAAVKYLEIILKKEVLLFLNIAVRDSEDNEEET